MSEIVAQPLSAAAFAPFGDVLEAAGAPDNVINQGMCERFHDRARLDFDAEGRAGVSLFRAVARSFPYKLELVERHPFGSQAFLPMSQGTFLVVVAEGHDDTPGPIHAFLSAPGQGINFHRGTWHGVLTPLSEPGLFAVVDRIGTTPNLEEHWFPEPFTILPPAVAG